jgi:hypothetical protein
MGLVTAARGFASAYAAPCVKGLASRAAVVLVTTWATPAANAAGTIQFSERSVDVVEGGARQQVALIRSGDASGPVTVLIDVDTSSGTAVLNTDFTVSVPAGSVSFADGEIFRLIDVSAPTDAAIEGTEYAVLAVTAVTGAAIGAQDTLRLQVRDSNAAASTFDFTTNLVRVTEGNAAALTVTHSATSAGTVNVSAAAGSATLGVDYSDPTTTLGFAQNSTQQTVSVLTIADPGLEGDETIELLLSEAGPPGSAVVREIAALVVIEDDEPEQAGELTLTATSGAGPISVSEQVGTVSFTVRRTGGSSGAATVDYATHDATSGLAAIAGQNYVAATGTLTFATGETERTFSVQVLDNTTFKLDSAFRVVLVNPSAGATLNPAANGVTVTVLDNDPLPDGDGVAAFSGDGCFVATAAYGSYLDPHVATLRRFRDRYLLQSRPGRAFVAWYYRVSPSLADIIARHDSLRFAARWVLTPLVYAVAYPLAALCALLSALTAACLCPLKPNRGS